MMPEARKLRDEVSRLEDDLASAKFRLGALENNCRHDWNTTEYVPKIIPGYHDPGDPPSWHGADKRLPMDAPEQVIPRWRRTCKFCGRTEETERADIETMAVKKPRF